MNSESNHELGTWDGFVSRLYAQNEFAIKLGLDSMRRALDLESHPERSHPAILVAGTNGKGGTASFLASVLQAHGLRVGLYTSPHIMSLRERFRIDGAPAAQSTVHSVGRRVLEIYGDPEDASTPRLTFFELTTLTATLIFRDAEVDVGVYEVGLGGRLDATNALEPSVSVITSISLDHQKYLGDDIASVAREKCGIIREDKPVVVGHQSYRAALDEIGSTASSRTRYFGTDYGIDEDEVVLDGLRIGMRLRGLVPQTRRWNAATAVAAAREWLGEDFAPDAAEHGLECTYWPGRMELRRLPEGPRARTYLFDAAHNPDSAQSLFDFLETSPLELSAVICGGMGDKDLSGVFERIPEDVPVFAAHINSARAADEDQVRAVLSGKHVRASGPTDDMLERAALAVDANDVVLVFGSIYLIGEAFAALGVQPGELRTFIRQPAPS